MSWQWLVWLYSLLRTLTRAGPREVSHSVWRKWWRVASDVSLGRVVTGRSVVRVLSIVVTLLLAWCLVVSLVVQGLR